MRATVAQHFGPLIPTEGEAMLTILQSDQAAPWYEHGHAMVAIKGLLPARALTRASHLIFGEAVEEQRCVLFWLLVCFSRSILVSPHGGLEIWDDDSIPNSPYRVMNAVANLTSLGITARPPEIAALQYVEDPPVPGRAASIDPLHWVLSQTYLMATST